MRVWRILAAPVACCYLWVPELYRTAITIYDLQTFLNIDIGNLASASPNLDTDAVTFAWCVDDPTLWASSVGNSWGTTYHASMIRGQGNPTLVMMLVANKADLETKREVATEEGERYAQENGLLVIETSAKTAQNVNELFYEIGNFFVRSPCARLYDNISLSLQPNPGFIGPQLHFIFMIQACPSMYDRMLGDFCSKALGKSFPFALNWNESAQ
ncbi:hypothetical protein HHK36_016649 [Tetracentron sinense]|uniref:Uncharacterized protein n=1 Tax=Tetracentron sinense TaxID=13715 RepID=A0A835DEF3_TETSI|nr:hypothetical protein HHK36_016649 [Tetracentron sinense]